MSFGLVRSPFVEDAFSVFLYTRFFFKCFFDLENVSCLRGGE